MDLHKLNALIAVAEHQSFSGAARALHTVQSNVSTHISRLEREVGVTLIDRARRDLTPEGEVVASRARRILLDLQAITEDLASMRQNVTGSVRVGVIGTTARWIVPLLLDEVHELHPQLELIVVDATTTSLMALLIQNRLEMAMVNLPVNDRDIVTEDLFAEDRIVVVAEDHELADRDRVDLSELAHHEILLPPQGTAFRDEIDADARRAELVLRTKAVVDGLRLLTSLAFQGFAPALLPASATQEPVPEHGWRSVPVDRLSPRLVGLARNRRTVPAAAPLVVAEIIRKIVKEEVLNHPHMHLTVQPKKPPNSHHRKPPQTLQTRNTPQTRKAPQTPQTLQTRKAPQTPQGLRRGSSAPRSANKRMSGR